MTDLPEFYIDDPFLPSETDGIAAGILRDNFDTGVHGLYLGLFIRRCRCERPIWEVYKPGERLDDFPDGDSWKYVDTINVDAFMSADELIAGFETLKRREKLDSQDQFSIEDDPKLN